MKARRWFMSLLLLVLLGAGCGYWRYLVWRDHSQDLPILAAARRYGVEPALVKAVVWRESRFNASARGSRGEVGLMQVLPKAAGRDWAEAEGHATKRAPEMSDEILLDPGTNTAVGAWYLEHLLKRYIQTDRPMTYAMADYNAGRGNVLKWMQGAAATNSAVFLEQIGFPGTRTYVVSVLRRYEHYRPIFPERK